MGRNLGSDGMLGLTPLRGRGAFAHLVHDPDVVLDDHVPAEIGARDVQVAQVRQALAPALQRRKPVHAWRHGNPGTGKTVTARWVTERLWNEGGLKGLYLNCWRHPTDFSILGLIVRELRMVGAERLTVSLKLERLSRHLEDTPSLIVLDEVDQPPTRFGRSPFLRRPSGRAPW